LYRFTGLARRLDPAWPTNRAVLVLMPLAAVAAVVLAPLSPGLQQDGRLWAGALAAATVLGTWALGRELAPDDQRAAFVCMALGLAGLFLLPGTSVVLLFATLTLVRIVNRTVGLTPTVLDGVAAVVLVGWAIASTRSYGVGLAGAAALGRDATLPGGRKRQWGFAVLCLVLVGLLAAQAGMGRELATEIPLSAPSGPALWAALAVMGLYLLALAGTREVRSVADATGDPLSSVRVRWGMFVGLLAAAQGLAFGDAGVHGTALVWAGLAGVGLSKIAPRGGKPDGA
jgi:hypothetical protein